METRYRLIPVKGNHKNVFTEEVRKKYTIPDNMPMYLPILYDKVAQKGFLKNPFLRRIKKYNIIAAIIAPIILGLIVVYIAHLLGWNK